MTETIEEAIQNTKLYIINHEKTDFSKNLIEQIDHIGKIAKKQEDNNEYFTKVLISIVCLFVFRIMITCVLP